MIREPRGKLQPHSFGTGNAFAAAVHKGFGPLRSLPGSVLLFRAKVQY